MGRAARLSSAVLALVSACASPLGGEDIDAALGLSALPGLGANATLAQRIAGSGATRLDFELDLAHQELEDAGARGDDWDRIRVGLKLAFPAEDDFRWTARAGGVWLRAEGDPVYLDAPGDYGGVFVGVGFEFDLGPALATGPELSLSALDAEGSGDFGWSPELVWRWIWHL